MASIDLPPDLVQLLHQEMVRGQYGSEQELLRDALQALIQQREDLDAIRAGIDDMEAGRMRPLRDAFDTIRKNHGFSSES